MRHLTIVLVVLLSGSVHVLPQVPVAAQAAGSIEGIVVRSDNGAAVLGAQVQLTFEPLAGSGPTPTAGTPPTQRVMTDSDGRFTFKDVTAGGYRMGASAEGFVSQGIGQSAINGLGRLVFVTAGRVSKEAAIRLVATGIVHGRVFDERAQPATGAPVLLLRAVYNREGRSLRVIDNGVVNDRGEYRMFGVPPGRYYLLAGPPPGGTAGLRGVSIETVRASRFGLLYYPAAEDIEKSLMIEVKAGEETSVDMSLRRQVQSYRVRGRVVNASGLPLPANVQVNLAYRFLTRSGSIGGGRAFDPATGTFELQNVAPGDWIVQASVPPAGPSLDLFTEAPLDAATMAEIQVLQASRPTGSLEIKVVDRDVEGLVVTLSTGFNTTGRITVEGQQQFSLPANLSLSLQFATQLVNQPLPFVSPAAADGSFQVIGLRETEYRAQFWTTAVPDLYVKSITYDGGDILNKPLSFSSSGAGKFDVVLSPGAVRATGTVTDAMSQPVAGIQVVLIPAQRTRTDLYRTAITDQGGRFTMPNIPPGEYKAFSWEAIDNSAYFDPEVLRRSEAQGKSVQIVVGSSPTVDLKVIPVQ